MKPDFATLKPVGQTPDFATLKPVVTEPEENPYGAFFRASPDDNPLEAGAKTLGNLPSSLFSLGKGIVKAVVNLPETVKAVGQTAAGGAEALTGLDVAGPESEQAFEVAKGFLKQRYGSWENLQKTATEDPVGFALDILSVPTLGATLVGRTAQVANIVSKVASPITKTAGKIATGTANKVGQTAKFGTSQLTGLTPETLSTIVNETADFGAAQKAGRTRVDLADDVFTAIGKAQDDLSDIGSGYDQIRKGQATITLDQSWLTPTFEKYGLKIDTNGQVIADKSSKTRNATDIAAIQNFIDNWGDSRTLTANEYLNMRHDLAELAKYDQSGKSTVARQFAQDVREGVLNRDTIRGQVPGLKELDAKYSADKQFLQQIEKDFIDKKTGNLKDGAASKLVNSITAANPERLARLEKFYPGFEKQARLIKALEDVEAASGFKVGTYTRAGVVAGQLATGNIPTAIITAILSAPEVAVPLLKGLGLSKQAIGPALVTIRSIGSDINNLRFPQIISEELRKKYPNGVPLGLSIESKRLSPFQKFDKTDQKVLREFAKLSNPSDAQVQFVGRLLESYGYQTAKSRKAIMDSVRTFVDAEDARVFNTETDDALARPYGRSTQNQP